MATKPKPCICESIPGWKTKVDINNKPLTCLAGVSYEMELNNFGDPLRIYPEPTKCPACYKWAYKCQKCENAWMWDFGNSMTSKPSRSYTVDCTHPNGLKGRAPSIIGWWRIQGCAYAVFKCTEGLGPYRVENGQFVYDDGTMYTSTENPGRGTRKYVRFMNDPPADNLTISGWVPAFKFRDRNIRFARPKQSLGWTIDSVNYYSGIKNPVECSAVVPTCSPNQRVGHPCHSGCNKPDAPSSPVGSIPGYPLSSGCTDWDWLPEYGKRGIRYSCGGWKSLYPPTRYPDYPYHFADGAMQDVNYVYAYSPNSL